MSTQPEQSGVAASTRGVDYDDVCTSSSAGGHGGGGLLCQQCKCGLLRTTSIAEGRTGALHEHVTCPYCSANGCLSTNMTGTKSMTRRGRALTGGGQDA